ncbi:MAG: hypothetical protein JW909_09135 [Planctomycetes bacterium]|nr:hypothetical protein [Planctomycetota bacterium]
MKRFGTAWILLLAAATTVVSAVEEQPAIPEKTVEEALQALEESVRSGKASWWESTADPAIKTVATYTGLGSDCVTVFSLDQIDKLWPKWKSAGNALDKFGLAVAIYSCVEHAANGRHRQAAMLGTKTYATRFISKMSASGPLYAAGIGIIDFSLEYLGNAAQAQISSDYWREYCKYQTGERPALEDYTAILNKDGYTGLTAALDSFWDDPASAGIRGWYTMTKVDPSYREHFRNRYIREKLLDVLKKWVLEQETAAYVEAKATARQLMEAVLATEITVTASVYERYTGKEARGYVAELRVDEKGEPIASTPLQGRDFSLTLRAADLFRDGKMSTRLYVSVRPAKGIEGTTAGGTVDIRSSGNRVKKSIAPGRVTLSLRRQFVVETALKVDITVANDPQGAVTGVRVLRFQRVPPNEYYNALGVLHNETPVTSTTMKNGKGTIQIPAGRYYLEGGERISGPYDIEGEGEITLQYLPITAREGDRDPTAPDAAGMDAAAAELLKALESGEGWYMEHVRNFNRQFEAYWLETQRRLMDIKAVRTGLEMQRNAVLQRTDLAEDEKNAQAKALEDRRQELWRRFSDSDTAVNGKMNDHLVKLLEKSNETAARERRISEAIREVTRASDKAWYPLQSAGAKEAYSTSEITTSLEYGTWQREEDQEALIKKAEEAAVELASLEKATGDAAELMGTGLGKLEKLLAEQRGNMDYLDSGDAVSLLYSGVLEDRRQELQLVNASRPASLGQTHLERLKKKMKEREAAKERARELLAQIEAAAKELPEIDGLSWKNKTQEITGRHTALVDALRGGQPERGGETWAKLLFDMNAWFDANLECVGDLLPPTRRQDTAFSRYLDTYRKIDPGAFRPYVPSDWYKKMQDLAYGRIRDRNAATAGLLETYAQSDLVFKLGTSNEARMAKIRSTLGEVSGLTAPEEKPGTGERIRQLEKARALLDTLPKAFTAEAEAQWERTRTALVQSGEVDTYVKSLNGPHIVIDKINGEPYGKSYYWPEKPPESKETPGNMDITLKVNGVPEYSFHDIYYTYTGTKWIPISTIQGEHVASISTGANLDNFEVTADLPGGKTVAGWEILPIVRLPKPAEASP